MCSSGSRTEPRRGNCRGLTILETVVAAFVLSVAVVGIGRVIISADAVRGHARQVGLAALVVLNESERIRNTARLWNPVNDTSYVVVQQSVALEVRRRALRKDVSSPTDSLCTVQVQIDVLPQGREAVLLSARLLQGYGN
jgi:Tfp pilus assembly protein PilV